MARRTTYTTVFVEHIPEQLEEGVLYVAPHFECAVHKCMCGCGEIICTPITSGQWEWEFDRYNVTLHPSIGNFQYPCKSHYFLRKGQVQWC